MNLSMIRHLLGKLLIIEAGLMMLPLVVAVIYHEPLTTYTSFIIPIVALLIIGGINTYYQPKVTRIYAREGLLIVALCWIIWSFFGALPFVLTGQIPSLIDAFFETSSGFTTTGATILETTAVLSPTLIFWRSFTHLIGGMGVLVFALAIMDNNKNNNLEIMRAEVPGPVFGKLVSRLKETAQILYIIYLVMFVILTLLLWWAGMPLFDSIIIGMGTAGTGGFAPFDDSIAHYQNSVVNWLVTGGMFAFGVNFNLYYLLLLRKFKLVLSDDELKTYFIIITTSVVLLFLNVGHLFPSVKEALEAIFFQVATILSSTGYGLTDTTSWPLFSQVLLLMLMFIGGMAGSTAGGFKVMRFLILVKIFKFQALQNLYPNRVLTLHINGKSLDKATQHSILRYFITYVALFVGLVIILSLDNNNFLSVVSASASIFNNIGPMLGTSESFAIFSPLSKFILSLAMIAGRLEIFPMLLLFSKKAWSKY